MINEPYDVKNISKYHEDFLSTMNLPKWIPQLICPQCKEQIGLFSLREMGLKLNPQYITNFFIGVCCHHCNYGYELHIQNKCATLQEFTDFLKLNNIEDEITPDYLLNPVNNNLLNIILKPKVKNDT